MYPFFFLVKTAGAIIYQYLISFFLEEKIGDGIISYFTISVWLYKLFFQIWNACANSVQ